MPNDASLKPSEIARRKRHRRRRNLTAALGAVVILFAVVGVGISLFAFVKWGIGVVQTYSNPAETPAYYADYLNPVVGLDPEPVSDLESSDLDWKLEAAIWDAAVQGKNNGTYSTTDNQRLIVPSQDVLNSYETLFGDRIEPVYRTLTENGVSFEFDSKRKCFYVPMNAVNYIFISKVTHISRSGNTVTLTVQYLPSSGYTGQATVNVPSKTMTYILKGGRGSYSIDAIRSLSSPSSSLSSSAASSSPSSSPSSSSSISDESSSGS